MTCRLLIMRVFLFLFLAFISSICYGQDTARILFVGNSFTFFWNVPEVVSSIAKTQGLAWECHHSTVGGANWEEHWKGQRDLQTVETIKRGGWDYVVLQNHSSSSIDRKEKFDKYGQNLIRLIKSVGAKPILYLTWSYENNIKMQKEITKGYKLLAKRTGTEVVPVGEVWDNVRMKYPEINLYHDNKHQSPLGTYLIALSFFKKISKRSVRDVPRRLTTQLPNGELLYLLFIKETEANRVRNEVEAFEF